MKRSWWARLKLALGLARRISPDVDAKLREAEELGRKVEQAAETARQVDALIDEIRSPGSCRVCGAVPECYQSLCDSCRAKATDHRGNPA